MSEGKVYILDHELISPIAVGKEQIIPALKSNVNADRKIMSMDVSGLPFQNGAEVQEDLSHYLKGESDDLLKLCEVDRKMELLAAAYNRSADRMKTLLAGAAPERIGVVLGVGAEVLPLKENEPDVINFIEKELNAICELIAARNTQNSRFSQIVNPYDIYAQYLAEKFNAKAFQKSILTACVSSTQAMAQAYDAIKRGEADVVITGGTDSIVNLIALISFGKLGVISESDGDISCRPFDLNRKGTIAGEAAGISIVASEEYVRKQGLKPLASIRSYGNTLDAYKITAPDPDANSMSNALKLAMQRSGLTIEYVDFYYAHGTGTRQNDGTELKALKMAFGEQISDIPISSTKDRHGHAIAAAGIQEISILLEIMREGYIPENMNVKHPIDQGMKILTEPLEKEVKFALKSNFAFGGINTVICIENEG